MRNRFAWVAFLVTCFLLTGLVGLFASYSASIPLERGLHRIEATPADSAKIIAETQAEADEVAHRTRLLIIVLTVLSASVGTGILLLVSKQARAEAPSQPGTPSSRR